MPGGNSRPIQRLRVSTYSRRTTAAERRFYGTIVDGLIARRKAAGISQSELDEQLGIATGLVAKWECYDRLPGAFMLMCWASSLGARLTIREE